jgi:hypothetical protein
MPEESSEAASDRHDRDARREARRREERWWRGGLIAALVFLGLATLYNGIAYRRLARAQQKLTLTLTHQRTWPGFSPIGPPYGQGFPGRPFPLPFAGTSPNYGGPGWGGHPCYPPEQGQKQEQAPGAQSTPGQ